MPRPTPGALIDAVLPRHDARTVQQLIVDATPAAVYDAIWQADLLDASLARMLTAVARVPELVAARHRGERMPAADRRWGLAQALDDDSPWILLGERPDSEVVLGLLWTPPAGGTTCAAEDFARFRRPGVAKVAWSLAVVPYGRGSILITETRTLALDRTARRRFRIMWPIVDPFAALARGAMMRAIARQARRSSASHPGEPLSDEADDHRWVTHGPDVVSARPHPPKEHG